MIETLIAWAEPLFLRTVNVSISASWLVLAVLLARLLLRRGPRWGSTALWAVVGLRLIWPFSIQSPASLVPSAKTVDPATLYTAQPAIQSGFRAVDWAVNPVLEQTFAPTPGASANPLQILVPLAALLWLAVAAGMGLYALAGWLRLRRRMSTAVRLEGNVYQSEAVASPFILGLVRPKIYLPFALSPREMALVLAHERAHLARRDHWWKPLGFALLAVHWFNPLLWLAYLLLCRDIELACDQRVIQNLTAQDRADYSQALLDYSARRGALRACPLAFGEMGVKERVKRILRYKKPALWMSVLAVLLCAVAAACFLTDPATPASEDTPAPIESASPTPDLQPEATPWPDFFETQNMPHSFWFLSGAGAWSTELYVSSDGSFQGLYSDSEMGSADPQLFPNGTRYYCEFTGAFGPLEQVDDYTWRTHLQALGYPPVEVETIEDGVRLISTTPYGLEAADEILILLPGRTTDDLSERVMGWLSSASAYWDETPETLPFFVLVNTAQEQAFFGDRGQTMHVNLGPEEDTVSYTLPAGLTATEYDLDVGPAGGVLLKPDAYELVEGDLWGAPAEWRAAGMVARYYTEGLVEWDGDQIATVGEFYNHTSSENIGPVDGLCAPGFLKKSNHDLYTAAELDALAQDGVDTESLETTSDYWYLWLARPGEETGYVLSLNAKHFTQEDLLAFARSFSY